MIHTTYLLTGSNLGAASHHLLQAAGEIGTQAGKITGRSGFYRTAPWGNTEQPAFLNEVLRVETSLLPRELLRVILAIEEKMGRVRTQKWAPRIIDIDILFYDDLVIEEEGLQVPHPHLHERRFVLEPLAFIAPAHVHPLLHKTVEELLRICTDTGEVEKL
jgi:2-amino-4-hydroxy-6-hydroxymethyldihydropteridine diphosphokinase